MIHLRPALPLLLAASLSACGHSEEEWQQKLREVEDLRAQRTAEQAQSKKEHAELEEAAVKIEQLKQQLKAAGVDASNVNASLEQARALEDHRRRAALVEGARKRLELLRHKLAESAKAGVSVIPRAGRVVIQIPGDALFEGGREALRKDGEALLLKIAEALRSDPSLASRAYQVACHVDSAAEPGRFKDRWGQSAMRAREVLAAVVRPGDKNGGLDASKWSVAGHADGDPLKSNESPEGRRANRRCEIVLVPGPEELLDLSSLGP